MFQFNQDVANTRYADRLREAHDHRVRNAFRRTFRKSR
ncbi:hypothetical protein JOD67_002452 [Tenggerimyces flavus]|nr:hypothetical protein [Tenggerimyces flavus]